MAKTTFTVDLLNTIRNMASTEYKERIPKATQDNMTLIAQGVTTHQERLNEFTGLVVKIGMQIFATKMAINPLSVFKKGTTDGTDIEEIFVSMAKSSAFDPKGEDLLTVEKADVKALYYSQNYQAKYKGSISDQQAKNAFLNPNGLSTLMNQIVASLMSGATHDEYLNMKKLLAGYKDKYADYQVPVMTSEANAKKFVKTVRKASMDVAFMSDKYNAMNVLTRSDTSEQTLIIHKDIVSEISVDVLATAFNMDKVSFMNKMIVVDDFGDMTDTYALLIDDSFFHFYDTLNTQETFRNASNLTTNYFKHVWQIHALSKFKNAIRFTTATVTP